MTQIAQELVRAFRGEDRKLPDDLLPDAVSPNALNVDYSRGTIRKRDGFVKLHGESIKEGGVCIANANQNACVYIQSHTDYDLVGDFTVEFKFQIFSLVFDHELVTKINEGSAEGWFFEVLSTGRVRFQMYDSVGATKNRTSPIGSIEIGKTYHVLARRTATSLSVLVDGIQIGSIVVDGETVSTRDIYIGAFQGATPAAQFSDFIISEFRIWSDFRSDAEIAQYKDQQLDASELLDANLVGYWPMTDAQWNIVEDKAPNLNHGAFFTAGPSSVDGLLLESHKHSNALRFDAGVKSYAETAYSAAYAPILDTGKTWTIEGWFRVDKGTTGADGTFFCLGNIAIDNGAPMRLLHTTALALKYTYSTTTTHNNAEVTTDYIIAPGIQFHVALVRDDTTITLYINGQQFQQTTGVASENGPTSSTAAGAFFGHAVASGPTKQSFGNVTVGEVRLWSSARSQPDIERWMSQEFLDVENPALVGYWRFDAPDRERDETEFSDLTLSSDGDKPEWTFGLVYPANPPRLQLVAPLAQAISGDELRSGIEEFHREILVATHTDFFNIVEGRVRHLKRFEVPGDNARFDWCIFQNKLIMCNGLEPNTKYSDIELPRSVTIETPDAGPTLAESGTGSGWTSAGRSYGDYSYRYSYRNERDGSESLASAVATIEVTTPKAQVDISDLVASTNPQVTHIRIYRLDTAEGATVYRFLADVENGTTTATDTGTDVSNNDIINDLRGHLGPQNWCATYDNRLWFASVNAVYFSEAGTIDFTPINVLTIDPSEGDVITGLCPAFGGLVVFKRQSIYFLSGHGASSFIISKTVAGTGCVTGQTIAESPGGLYFLGFDGVYLFNGAGVQYLSITQQDLFLTQNPDLYHEAAGVYDPKTHQYLVSFDSNDRQLVGAGSYYDVQPGLYTNYYKLADNTDETGAADLTETDAPSYVTDSERGTVASFNGTSDEMVATTVYPTQNRCTIGCWFRAGDVTTNQVLLNLRSDGVNIATLFFDEGKVKFAIIDSGSTSKTTGTPANFIKSGVWYHVVGERTINAVTLFINGAGISFQLPSNIGFDGAGAPDFHIGHQSGASYFDGEIQNAFYLSGASLFFAQIKEIYRHEAQSAFLEENRITMLFDEESNSWAKWDVGFDYLAVGAQSQNRIEMLGGRNGYVHRLFDGGTDGSTVLGGSIISDPGSVTANSSAEIEDTDAAFSTDEDGLKGASVLVQSSTDTTTQLRLIIGNTATKLYLDRPFSPEITGTYYVAPIDFYWESRWMDFGDPAIVKRLFFTHLWLKESTTTVTFKWKSDAAETFQSTTFSTVDEFVKLITSMRGRKFICRFEHVIPNEDVEIVSFQGIFSPKRWR